VFSKTYPRVTDLPHFSVPASNRLPESSDLRDNYYMLNPESVRVAITATDETSPAFQSAQTKVTAFQQTTEYSLREARASAKLLSEELGVNLNRHLISVIANTKALGSVLAGAFSVAAGIAFFEVAAEQAKKIYDLLNDTAGETDRIAHQEKLAETFQEVAKHVAKIHDQMADIGKSSQAIAVHAMEKAQYDLISASAAAKAQASMAASLRAGVEHHQTEPGGALAPFSSTTEGQAQLQMANLIGEQAKAALAELPKLQAEFDLAVAKMGHVETEGADSVARTARAELLKDLHEINAQATEFWKSWRQLNDELDKSVEKMKESGFADFTKRQSDFRAQFAPWMNPAVAPPAGQPMRSGQAELLAIQGDQNKSWEAAKKIIDDTATASQKYSDTIAVLTELLDKGRISQDQFAAAAVKAGADLDKSPYKKYYEELGRDIGRTIEQAALFEGSWSHAFKALLADVVKLVAEMYVFKSLADQYGGANGGFLGAFFSGLAGQRASGGPVNASMSYIVGESGPELFTPGVSGAITPNGALGGQIVQHFDMRGSVIDGDVVKKAELAGAMHATENRAVARAVAATADQRARR